MVRLTPKRARSVSSTASLECFSCGAMVDELAEFEDDRGVAVLLCLECEDDVLAEMGDAGEES